MHCMTRIVLFLLLLFPLYGNAQTAAPAPEFSYHVTIDLLNVTPDKDRVKVTITTPPIQATTIRYVLPEYLPGVPGRIDAGRFVHQFYALDDKGFPLKVKKKSENIIEMKMRKGATLKKIEYWVDDTWDDEKLNPRMSEEKFNYVPQVAGSNIEAGTNFVINHAFFFGYLEGYPNLPYTIHVLRPAEMEPASALSITETSRSRDEYHASNYAELVDNPVMYSVPDTAGFLSGNIYVRLSVFSENGKVSARFVRKILAAQIAAATNFLPELNPQHYELIFYFTTPFRTVMNLHGSYGGLAHRHSAFYFLPELADPDALEKELLRETSGDLMHLLAPLDYRASCGKDRNFLEPQLSTAWWFTQGVNQYFGWLAAVRDSFVAEEEFMGYVSARIRSYLTTPRRPLTDLANAQQLMQSPVRWEALRSKAMLTAFLLDIRLTEITGGSIGLREAVLQLGRDGRFNPDSLEQNLAKICGNDVHVFFRDYINGTKPLPLMESLGKISWAYAPEAVDSVLTFGHFGFLYDDEKDIFIVHNADTLNRFGLRDGDRLVSVDNVLVNASNFDDALQPVYSPQRNDEVEVHFIREKENCIRTAVPVSVGIVVEHLIRSDPAAAESAVLMHDILFRHHPAS